ncbi:hypothetical protein BGZ60DRAFT_91827 [Tricladium varicosporioides]|nr:hypothetical protein BGZ60DRAFT_91827 [Hymenoscyphus varicosporioides]
MKSRRTFVTVKKSEATSRCITAGLPNEGLCIFEDNSKVLAGQSAVKLPFACSHLGSVDTTACVCAEYS